MFCFDLFIVLLLCIGKDGGLEFFELLLYVGLFYNKRNKELSLI